MLEEIQVRDGQWMSKLIWSVLLTVLIYKLTIWFWKYRQMVAVFDKLPGKKETHWLLGHVHEHPGPGEGGLEFQMWFCRNFPRIHKFWFGKIRCIIVCHHPDTVREVLNYPATLALKPRGPGTTYEIGLKWLGEGLLIANGQRWARNRKLLTPAFHYDILQPYLGITNQCTDIFLEKLGGFAQSQTSFEVFQLVSLCSLDIITKCAFSFEADCQRQGDQNPYVQAVMRLQELWITRSLNPFLILDWFYFNLTANGREFVRHCHFVHKVAEEIIQKRKVKLESEGLPNKENDVGKKRSLDFLDIILTAKDEEGRGLTDLEIRDEVDTFLFEGHDTTTSATSFILLSLAQHPDIQDKCRVEIDSVLADRDTDQIEWKDLGKFPFLTQCIKEGLRMYSPVFFIQRQVSEDVNIDGYHIPAWTHIAMNIYNLHHNPAVWGEDAEEFKPERFSPENVAKMHPFQFIPFSAGQRNCIGQNFAMNEIKVIVGRTLRRYKLSVKPGHVIKKRMGIIMRTEDGAFLNVEPRTFV